MLDDPALPASLHAALFLSDRDDRATLVWQRQAKLVKKYAKVNKYSYRASFLNAHRLSSKLQVQAARCIPLWRENRPRYCPISRQETSLSLPPLPGTPAETI